MVFRTFVDPLLTTYVTWGKTENKKKGCDMSIFLEVSDQRHIRKCVSAIKEGQWEYGNFSYIRYLCVPLLENESFFPIYQDSATSVILSTATRKVTGSSSGHASNTSAAGSVSSSRPRPNFHNVVRKFSQQSTPGTNQGIFYAFSKNSIPVLG